MNLNKFFLILLLIPTYSFCQTTLIGSLVDDVTNEPIPYATVYVDGTAQGTISDSTGFFMLKNLQMPCKVVFSHINYKITTAEYAVNKAQNLLLNLRLQPKPHNIGPVTVYNKNSRKKNLKYFEKNFLGTNKWGDYAFIENEDVLFFNSSPRRQNKPYYLVESEKPDSFQAEASAPLEIKLPLLGYQIYVNLLNFSINYNPRLNIYQTVCKTLTYFKPIEVDSKNKQKRIEKHRKEVYYNSVLHFIKSLYNDELEENGFRIAYRELNLNDLRYYYTNIDPDSLIIRHDNQIDFIGLKNQTYYILYYRDKKNKPLNLNHSETHLPPAISSIYFQEDTCSIFTNGIQTEPGIFFGPEIGSKKAGTWLPQSYCSDNLTTE